MKNKLGKRLIAVLGTACMAVSILFTPVATKTVSAAMPEVSEPDQNIIEWMYRVDPVEKKLYKRLLNHSTGNWVGDWIYVRDLEDWEIELWLKSQGVL